MISTVLTLKEKAKMELFSYHVGYADNAAGTLVLLPIPVLGQTGELGYVLCSYTTWDRVNQ